eukprot:CAMPEP_0182424558 /NCGR_PEP_ID=MMETSP1167-20130531/10760_1 /TAXON_ID=2988 /ORGANISM="Mallomonas Sp, Strain CCMP3275" /LENGTH=563 /DNA_ID=CAMNT_0024604443 /DNA_START=430 /DNA_END=2121 /DNA_ORIENTATION=+
MIDSKPDSFKTVFSNYERHVDSRPLSTSGSAHDKAVPKASDWQYIKDPVSVVKSHNLNGIGKIDGVIKPSLLMVDSSLDKNVHVVTDTQQKAQQQSKDQTSSKRTKVSDVNSVIAKHENVFIEKHETESRNSKPAYDLSWPPVLQDGTIPEDEGYDIMTITDLKVPRFWEPKPGDDLNKIGTKVNGLETIFLMVASYRDFQCHDTITSAYFRADHPERLFVGAVEQNSAGDLGCAYTEKPCEEDPEQMICKYRDQISVYKMDAKMATGPVTGRHIGDRLYRGQYFVMQMDAHCMFIRHWDKLIINQWSQTHNEMAVLSSYLTDVQGSISPEGDSKRNTRPIMCNSDFEGAMPSRYLRHGAQPEDFPAIRESPQLQPFWAAGFSFSRGHFKVRVPYDGYQPMVFQGEEISIGIRGFTYGYDFYAPRDSVVFHEYAVKSKRRNKVPMFWENSQKHVGEGKKSLSRSMSIIKMAPDIDPDSWDHREEQKYGIGKERTVDLFYKLFLVDTVHRKATQLCPFVKSGIMHQKFTPHLKENRLGIDYTGLEDFDTKKAITDRLREIGKLK